MKFIMVAGLKLSEIIAITFVLITTNRLLKFGWIRFRNLLIHFCINSKAKITHIYTNEKLRERNLSLYECV